MGYGDDLLVTSLAAKIKKQFPERQIVIGIAEKNHAFHSPIYENNPNIADCRNLDNNKPIHLIDFHELNRPYIDYEKSIPNNYVWRNSIRIMVIVINIKNITPMRKFTSIINIRIINMFKIN